MLRQAGTRAVHAARTSAAARRGMATADGYLHKSKVPTMHYQDSLPRLPVPKLQDTLPKYLRFLHPLVTDDEFARATRQVQDFESGPGPNLQAELEAFDAANKHTSYLNGMWFDMYVRDRRPLPINSNPQLTFADDPGVGKMDPIARTAQLASSAARFYRTLRDGHLSPDVFHTNPARSETDLFRSLISLVPSSLSWYGAYLAGAYPLDMNQYGNLFHSTRVPHRGADEIRKCADPATKGRHVVVQRGAEFFAVDVLREDGTAVPDAEVLGAFRAIAEAPRGEGPHIGALTTLDRDSWADTRAAMEKDPVNRASLEAVDSALFAISLDDAAPEGTVDLSTTMLTGNGRSRWFDKSVQLVTCANGKAALNFEHAWGDGVAVLRFFNEIWQDAIDTPLPEAAAPASPPRLLEWTVDAAVRTAAEEAGTRMDAWLQRLDVNVEEVTDVDKTFPKHHGVSPDGFMQMAIQLAHYKLNGYSASTYESASTAAFKHGRTETIRSATMDSAAMCRAFQDPNASRADKEAALRKAIETHSATTKDCAMGKGVDRHLFALRHFADKHGTQCDLFSDETHARYNKIILSTSTLASKALDGGGFGPVNDDCFGIGYSIRDQGAGFVVSSYRPDGAQLTQALGEAVRDFADVLRAGKAQK